MNTHGNVSFNAQALRAWVGLTTEAKLTPDVMTQIDKITTPLAA